MKKHILTLLLLVGTLSATHAAGGIVFTKGLTWAQIKAKAQRENRYIFLDVYTTWCGPCRMMASQIFTQPKVGGFFNSKFINVAVQFDKTKADSREVKSWYKDAETLKQEYQVNAYPTYLFFNPQGQLVHRIEGASATADAFVANAKNALDPAKQYILLKQQFDKGKRDSAFLHALTNAAEQTNDSKFFPVAANAYLKTQSNLMSSPNLKLIGAATRSSSDLGFPILLAHARLIDSVSGKTVSTHLINTVVLNEIALPLLLKGGTSTDYGGGMIVYSGEANPSPQWQTIKAKLDSLYPAYANELLLSFKPVYYQWSKDWPHFVESVSVYCHNTDQQLLDTDALAQYAYLVFTASNQPAELADAIAWLRAALTKPNENNMSYLYIYGNLQYKFGQKEQGITTMKKILQLSSLPQPGISNAIHKMENNEKTW